LPFASQSFDIVLGNGVLHHLPNLAEVVPQIKRVLRPGGIYIGREPNFISPLIQWKVLGEHSSRNEHAVYRDEIISTFNAAGFETKVTYFWRRLPWLHHAWFTSSIAIHAVLKASSK
jgi:SAM-dependent methyltransferase